jgi:hypothetical protein
MRALETNPCSADTLNLHLLETQLGDRDPAKFSSDGAGPSWRNAPRRREFAVSPRAF